MTVSNILQSLPSNYSKDLTVFTNNVACCNQTVLDLCQISKFKKIFALASLMQTKSGLVELPCTKSTMEEMFLRFSHLSENIFNALDNHTFAICKEVSKVRYSYIDDRKRKVKVIKKITLWVFRALKQPKKSL